MRINACSVAFRHARISAAYLADYALSHGFDGLEIWAPHAQDMLPDWTALRRRPRVPMLAGYLPLGQDDFCADAARQLCVLTRAWGAGRLRLFAGACGSSDASAEQRGRIVGDLLRCADLAQSHGLRLAIETHPGTLADSPQASLALLKDAGHHPALGLNFDVLHIWEAGADPLDGFAELAPHVLHFHLKTVSARGKLAVFDPANIHAADGHRDGICPLFEGALDYDAILTALPADADGSLEWFGAHPAAHMAADLCRIRAGALGRARAA